jgi:hypothetical protein
MKSWRSVASAALLFVAANACGGGSISGDENVPVAGLRFSGQPASTGAAGTAFSVSVELLNSAGQKIGNADDNVTLATSGGGDLLGTLTQAAANGTATFTGLSMTRAGTGYTISASANGITASSSSFTVTPAAANAGQSNATYTPSQVTTGSTIAFVFTFKDQYGNPVPNKTVTLSSSLAGVTFTPATGTTSGTGTFTTNMVATTAGSATLSATVDGIAISLPTAVTISAPASFTITTSSSPANGGTTTGGGTFTQGTSVSLSATPAAGFVFQNWTEAGAVASPAASFTFAATANRTLIANFIALSSGDCTPASLPFPGTASSALPNPGACVINGVSAAMYRFIAPGTGGVTLTGTATYPHSIEVTTDPEGTGQVAIGGTGTIPGEWLLPAGTYLARLGTRWPRQQRSERRTMVPAVRTASRGDSSLRVAPTPARISALATVCSRTSRATTSTFCGHSRGAPLR